ncbi:unnamed protein product [Dracunculus medinensis]|uniref:SCP domain-containing protein n=1 Tax=Dracunculus medinensis TaxID=318479 RepID=A0A158Q5H7_DRAME|nr:unnamed protein product [Dracunculus medinensis]
MALMHNAQPKNWLIAGPFFRQWYYAEGLAHRPPSTTRRPCVGEWKRDFDRDKAVDAINTFRKELVNGKFRTKNAKFPKGREMYKMRWNCTLEKMAQEKASKCGIGTNGPPEEEEEDIGEATHVVFRPANSALAEPIHEALKVWVKRVEDGFEDNSLSTCEFFDEYAEFIQVASGLTTDVGCAMNPSCNFTENNNDYDTENIHDLVPTKKKKKFKAQRHYHGESFKKLYVKGKRCHRGWKCAKHDSSCNSDKLCEFESPGYYDECCYEK